VHKAFFGSPGRLRSDSLHYVTVALPQLSYRTICTEGGTRTHTSSRILVPKTSASAIPPLRHFCSPYGIRTHILALEERCPVQLNEGTICRYGRIWTYIFNTITNIHIISVARYAPFYIFCSPSWVRTSDLTVNSRLLYHWATEECGNKKTLRFCLRVLLIFMFVFTLVVWKQIFRYGKTLHWSNT
jgi:hypothetical protein